MPDSRPPLDPELTALLGSRQDGCGMPRAFYATEALYAAELQRIWQSGWLFAGFAFEVPNPGDFLTLSVGQAPVLVIRGDDGVVRAFHNVCRHRGSQICRTESGHVRALVCPYHSWTYSQRGELVACHGMHDGVDKSKLGLKPVRAEVVAGFIYLSLSESPPAIRRLCRALRGSRRAAGIRSRADRAHDRLRGRGELEARLGEQPRVLPLRAAPSAVREIELRRVRCGARVRRDPPADRRRARAHPVEVGGAGRRRRAPEGGPRHVSRPRPRPLVHVQPHRARRGLRHRIDGRHAGRAADGRLPRCRRRRAADAQPARTSGCTRAATTRS